MRAEESERGTESRRVRIARLHTADRFTQREYPRGNHEARQPDHEKGRLPGAHFAEQWQADGRLRTDRLHDQSADDDREADAHVDAAGIDAERAAAPLGRK